jgi:hypothetical protein
MSGNHIGFVKDWSLLLARERSPSLRTLRTLPQNQREVFSPFSPLATATAPLPPFLSSVSPSSAPSQRLPPRWREHAIAPAPLPLISSVNGPTPNSSPTLDLARSRAPHKKRARSTVTTCPSSRRSTSARRLQGCGIGASPATGDSREELINDTLN